MANEVKYPEAKYVVANVGPSREFSFTGNDGNQLTMKSYSVQFEGILEWVDVTKKLDEDLVKGDVLEGHIEDTGKFGMKFKAKRSGGGFGGGSKKNFAGAAYANAVQTATHVVIGYYQITGTKPKSIDEMLERIHAVTPKIKSTVDTFAGGSEKTEDPKTEAPTPVETPVQDASAPLPVDEKSLGW